MPKEDRNISVTISSNTLVRVFLTIVLIAAIIKLHTLVLIVLTSIVVASFVESAVKKFTRFSQNRTLIVFLIYLFVILLLAGLFTVFVPVFVSEISSLVAQLGSYIPETSVLSTFQSGTATAAQGLVQNISHNASLGEIINSVQGLASSVSGGFFNVFGSAFGGLFNVGLIGIISFYLSVKEKGIENFLRIIIPDSHEEYVIGLWQRTERKIGLWIQGQMLLGVIIGTLAYLGLTLLGVKYALVLALMTAFSELIPFGIFIMFIPVTLFAYLNGGITLALLTFGFYIILHEFETYLIYPLIVRKIIGISPLVVILSLLIGGELAGFWGIILAIPCAVCLLEFLDDIEKKKILSRAN